MRVFSKLVGETCLDDILTLVSLCSLDSEYESDIWNIAFLYLGYDSIWFFVKNMSSYMYLIKNFPHGPAFALHYCTNTKIALYFSFFLEEFLKQCLKQYVGSVQLQVTLKLCLWNSPEGPGCLVLHDVMQTLPFQQNNSVFTACN